MAWKVYNLGLLLQLAVGWVTNTKLAFNITKTKTIIFGSTQDLKAELHLRLHVGDVPVGQDQQIKFLQTMLDCK